MSPWRTLIILVGTWMVKLPSEDFSCIQSVSSIQLLLVCIWQTHNSICSLQGGTLSLLVWDSIHTLLILTIVLNLSLSIHTSDSLNHKFTAQFDSYFGTWWRLCYLNWWRQLNIRWVNVHDWTGCHLDVVTARRNDANTNSGKVCSKYGRDLEFWSHIIGSQKGNSVYPLPHTSNLNVKIYVTIMYLVRA